MWQIEIVSINDNILKNKIGNRSLFLISTKARSHRERMGWCSAIEGAAEQSQNQHRKSLTFNLTPDRLDWSIHFSLTLSFFIWLNVYSNCQVDHWNGQWISIGYFSRWIIVFKSIRTFYRWKWIRHSNRIFIHHGTFSTSIK